MKRFLKQIAVLVVFFIAMMYVLDVVYTQVYRNAKPRNKIQYVLSQKNQKVDYLFFGSSRVDNTIDPKVVEEVTGKKALNLGIQGARLPDYLILMRLAHEQGMIKDTVLVQVDYVYNIDSQTTSDAFKSALLPYMDNSVIDQYFKKYDEHYQKLKYVPFYRYMAYDFKIGFREFFNSVIGKSGKSDLSSGYNPRKGQMSKNFKSALPRGIAKDNPVIDEMNAFAQEAGFTIVYFMSPYCTRTTNLDFADKLSERIPELRNYTTLFTDKDETHFYNCSHLNHTGAQEFSRVLARDLTR